MGHAMKRCQVCKITFLVIRTFSKHQVNFTYKTLVAICYFSCHLLQANLHTNTHLRLKMREYSDKIQTKNFTKVY